MNNVTVLDSKHINLTRDLAAMKEDMKTLAIAGENEAMYELFVRETRRLLGARPELPKNFKRRTAEQIMVDLGFKQ